MFNIIINNMSLKYLSNIEVDGNITSDAFIKEGGTSSGFLKADGSVDTNTYSTSAGTVGGSGADNRLPKFSTGGNDVENSTISDNGTDVTLSEGRILLNDTTFNQIKSSGNTQYVGTTDGVNTLKVGTSTTGWKSVTTEAGSSEWKTGGTTAASLNHGTGNMVLEGSLTADSIVKDGGTSSQFLKADGSVDSTTYATGTIPTNNNQLTNGASYITAGDIPSIPTSSDYVDLTSTQTVGGEKTFEDDVYFEGSLSADEIIGDCANITGISYNQLSNTPTIPTMPTDFVSAANGGTFNNDVVVFGELYTSQKLGNLDVSGGMGYQFETPATGTQTLRCDSDAFRFYFGGSGGQLETFHLNQTGEVRIKKQGSTKHMFQNDGDAHHDGDVIAYSTTISDERLKDDIKTIENATDTVKNLRGVEYVWNSGHRKGQKEIGVIAQEVQKELPFLVREKEMLDGEKRLTVDYEKMIGLLIESNKELSARLEKLECGCSTCDCK